MALKNFLPFEKTGFTQLAIADALPALVSGSFCVIAPLPQLVMTQRSVLTMLLTAGIGPLCGILFMTGLLLKTD